MKLKTSLMCGLVLCGFGCSSGDGAVDSESVQADVGTATLLDSFEVAPGATVTVEASADGSIVVALETDKSTESEVNRLMEGVDGVGALYERLAPRRPIPEMVSRLLAERGDDTLTAVAPAPAITEPQVPAVVDGLARLDKEAPRNVTGFINSYCNADKVNEADVTNGWYRKNDICLTERTAGFTHSLTDVRQGYISLYMYRGSADLKWYWQATGGTTWTLGASHAVAEGKTKAFWLSHSGKKNIKYELANAANDGFHYAIHSAKANHWEKATSGNDYYHALCNCTETDNNPALTNPVSITDPHRIEICASNATENDSQSMASYQCGAWARELQSNRGMWISVSCSYVNHEKVSTGKACSAPLQQTIRDCVYGTTAACRNTCTATCF
jgi:hypothetical protein